MVDLSDWELATPDILAVIDELNVWACANNLKYEVVICNSLIQRTLLEKYQGSFTGVESKFVHNLKQAVEWLSTYGVIKI